MQFLSNEIRNKINDMLQKESATKDRSATFRVIVGVIVLINLFGIIYSLLKL